MTLLQWEAAVAIVIALLLIYVGLDDYLTADRYQAEQRGRRIK